MSDDNQIEKIEKKLKVEEKTNHQNIKKIKGILSQLDQYDTYFFDMDGVLWDGVNAIPGASSTIIQLQNAKKQVFFVTNHNSYSTNQLVEKLKKYNINIDKEFVWGAAGISCYFIKKNHPEVKKCYLIGSEGNQQEFNDWGIPFQSADEHNENIDMTFDALQYVELDPEVNMVVCGYDSCYNYRKACYASSYIQKGAGFIAACIDDRFSAYGQRWPSADFMSHPIAVTTGVQPKCTGKPNPLIVDMMCEKYSLDKKKSIFIGDSLKTDIMVGKNSGIDQLLVLSGNTDEKQLYSKENDIIPTYVSKSIAE